jgi:hypothetical protein
MIFEAGNYGPRIRLTAMPTIAISKYIFPNCRDTILAFAVMLSTGVKAICSAMNHSGDMNAPAKPATLDKISKLVRVRWWDKLQ